MSVAPVALITGATAGIGHAVAIALADAGYSVIVTGRREDRLQELQAQIEEKGGRCIPLCFDIRDKDETHKAIAGLSEEWKKIDILVNNAGLALGVGPISQGKPDDWDTMIDTNVKGLLYATHAVLPGMIERKKGHIVNLGSIAGKEVYPGGNVYCATKHAVDALTKAMRMDLLPFGIRVTGIHPGRVHTEFSLVRLKGDTANAEKVYQGYEPLLPEDIADAVRYAVTRPAHVTIDEMTIMPTDQANARDLRMKN